MKDFVCTGFPITPLLYIRPKIHKCLTSPLGRPMVSGGSLFNNSALFPDRWLREFPCNNLSYVKDTSDFLLKIQELKVNKTTILASFDVVSLYTSIAHSSSAVEKKLASLDMTQRCARLALTMLGYILQNYFLFGDVYYRQCRGTAIGSNVAFTYANI